VHIRTTVERFDPVQANEALDCLRRGEIIGAAVLEWSENSKRSAMCSATWPHHDGDTEVVCMLFEKLLVPLDGTAESAGAVPMARAMAPATGATFTLLRVVPTDKDEQARRQAQHDLDGIAAELTAGGLSAKTVVRIGDTRSRSLSRRAQTRPT
jgi:K+-sensing histidine kinase KdpD